MSDILKRCRECNIEKDISLFYPRHLRCKECISKTNKLFYKNNPEYFREQRLKYKKLHPRRDDVNNTKKIAIKLGISINKINKLRKKHNGFCDICNKTKANGHRLSIDHDHKTNKIRGFLCNKCNFGLGCFKDNIELLKRAIKYLEERR